MRHHDISLMPRLEVPLDIVGATYIVTGSEGTLFGRMASMTADGLD